MKIVVDASVALKWVIDEPDSQAAADLLDKELLSPSLWIVESANALWRRVHRNELTAAEAAERFAALLIAPVTTTPLEADATKALALSHELQHPVYDCTYLAATLRAEAVLVTADRRFHAAVMKDRRFTQSVRLLTISSPAT